MNLRHVPRARMRMMMSSNRAILALTGITSVAILHALIADRSGELSTRNMKKNSRGLIGFLLGILFYYIIENNNDNDFTPA